MLSIQESNDIDVEIRMEKLDLEINALLDCIINKFKINFFEHMNILNIEKFFDFVATMNNDTIFINLTYIVPGIEFETIYDNQSTNFELSKITFGNY